VNEHFTKQIEQGAEIFFYGIEREEPFTITIMRHYGSLDTFPTKLEYVGYLTDDWPMFKESK
jgi:hypothetical protein